MELKTSIFPVLCLFIVWASAQEPPTINEEITVAASKSETPIEKFGTSITVITAADIERHQWRTVSDALLFMPGVSLAQTGSDGGVATLFLRGAKSENMLVLVNGAKVNDPAGVARGYDFAHLSTAGIERIELILGPQSTLYGSDASAGVVNIVMKDGAQPHFLAEMEGSDEDSVRAGLAIGKRAGLLSYAAGLEFSDSESISARSDGFGSEPEEDGYRNLNGYLNLGYDLGPNRSLKFALTYTESDSEFDATDGDDPNFRGDYRQSTLSFRYEAGPSPGKWQYAFLMTRSQTDRTNRDEKDTYHPNDTLESDFQGVNLGAEFRNTFDFSDTTRLIAGLTLEREDGEGITRGESAYGPFQSEYAEDTRTLGLFSQLSLSFNSGWYATLGGRYDDHSQFGNHGTYQAALGYYHEATGTRIRAFRGTGFRAPSIFQLYSDSGNLELQEETGETWEIGVGQDLLEGKVKLGVTWFDNQYEDLIDFFFDPETFLGSYINIDEVETQGYEVFLSYRGTHLNCKVVYEELDADEILTDNLTGERLAVPLIRRYEDKASLLLGGIFSSSFRWNLDFLYYGESLDLDFSTFSNQPLDSYPLVHLGLDWRWGAHVGIQVRAENLTDETYAQVLNYTTHGRRFFLGVKYRR